MAFALWSSWECTIDICETKSPGLMMCEADPRPDGFRQERTRGGDSQRKGMCNLDENLLLPSSTKTHVAAILAGGSPARAQPRGRLAAGDLPGEI